MTLNVLLLGAENPYLDMLLGLHGFQVRRGDPDGAGDDAIVLVAPRPMSAIGRSDLPVLVVPLWKATPEEAQDMVRQGADDVLPMADLSGSRLEAALRKSIERHNRRQTLPATATGLVHWFSPRGAGTPFTPTPGTGWSSVDPLAAAVA